MNKLIFASVSMGCACIAFTACQPPSANVSTANSNVSRTNSFSNAANSTSSNANSAASMSVVDAKEPERYGATVKLTLEATGDQQKASLPTVSAVVARDGDDRRMEFALPSGEKVVYLDTAAGHYLILPNRKQYAELSKETLGVDIRRMMMPEQIVNQLKSMQGVQRAGEENVNGRKAIKYTYAATANTQTQAGQVDTDSYMLIDSETGLPLRSETVSQSQNGANVQGYKGMRLVTEMTDIQMDPDPTQFKVPTEFAVIDPQQVKAQINLIFSAVAAIAGQAMQQAAVPAAGASPSPTR